MPMDRILSSNLKSFLLFFALSMLFYGNSIRNSFSFDDSYVTVTNFKAGNKKYVPNNPYVAAGISGIPKLWQSRYGHGKGTSYDYRPVVTTLFAIEYSLFGQSPHINHFVSILLFACCVFMAYLLLRKCFANAVNGKELAFLASLLFLAHPLHTEVVSSIKSSDELLGLLFGLLTTNLVLDYFETKKTILLIPATLCFLLAIYSKLSVIVFAALIPLTLGVFKKANVKALVFVSASVIVLFLAQGLIKNTLVAEKQVRYFFHFENPLYTENISFAARIMFTIKTFGVYVKLLFFPYPLRYYYGSSVITTNVDLSDPDVWIGLLFLVSASYFCYKTANRKAWYGLLFFLVGIFPFLNIIKPVPGIVGERFAFIGSLGFCVFLAVILLQIFKSIKPTKAGLPLSLRGHFLVGGLLTIALFYTWDRNAHWKDEITLFEHDAAYLQQSAPANSLLANKYMEMLYTGQYQENTAQLVNKTWKYLQLAITADSSIYMAQNNAGVLAFRFFNKPDLALTYFLNAIKTEPNLPQTYENIGDCYRELGDIARALVYYKMAIRLNPLQHNAILSQADILMRRREFGEALTLLKAARLKNGTRYDIVEKTGNCLLGLGNKQEGAKVLEEAYQIRPNPELAHQLNGLFLSLNRPDKASLYPTEAMSKKDEK